MTEWLVGFSGSLPISAVRRRGQPGVRTPVVLCPGVDSLECEILLPFVQISEEFLFLR